MQVKMRNFMFCFLMRLYNAIILFISKSSLELEIVEVTECYVYISTKLSFCS